MAPAARGYPNLRAESGEEVDEVVERRSWPGETGRQSNGSTVVEPELDMDRSAPRPSPLGVKLRALVSRLVAGAPAIRAPMRALQRELEERWPGLER